MSQSLQGGRTYLLFDMQDVVHAPAFQGQCHDHQTRAKDAHSDVKETGREYIKCKADERKPIPPLARASDAVQRASHVAPCLCPYVLIHCEAKLLWLLAV